MTFIALTALTFLIGAFFGAMTNDGDDEVSGGVVILAGLALLFSVIIWAVRGAA